MGLGPKYEGSFIPPGLPVLPSTADADLQAYHHEVVRYIEQLHDQLQATFEMTQITINQLIYQGDGDGGAQPGDETEEGGVDISSVVASGGDVAGQRAFLLFPQATSSPGVNPTSGEADQPVDEIWVWPLFIPFTCVLNKVHIRGKVTGGGAAVAGFGLYNWDGARLVAGTFSMSGAGYANYTADITNVKITPGLYRVAWSSAANGLALAWHAGSITVEKYVLMLDAMGVDCFGKNDVNSTGNGAMPAMLGTLGAIGGVNADHVTQLLFEMV